MPWVQLKFPSNTNQPEPKLSDIQFKWCKKKLKPFTLIHKTFNHCTKWITCVHILINPPNSYPPEHFSWLNTRYQIEVVWQSLTCLHSLLIRTDAPGQVLVCCHGNIIINLSKILQFLIKNFPRHISKILSACTWWW